MINLHLSHVVELGFELGTLDLQSDAPSAANGAQLMDEWRKDYIQKEFLVKDSLSIYALEDPFLQITTGILTILLWQQAFHNINCVERK